jgi:hypothetical protein
MDSGTGGPTAPVEPTSLTGGDRSNTRDERKTKAGIKRDLLDAGGPCHSCHKPFETRRAIHLHRLDGSSKSSLWSENRLVMDWRQYTIAKKAHDGPRHTVIWEISG